MSGIKQVSVIGVIGFIVGVLAILTAVRIKPEAFIKSPVRSAQIEKSQDFANQERNVFKDFDEQFGQDVFSNSDHFANIKKLRDEMAKGFAANEDEFSLNDPSITQREDKNYVYYDIKVDDLQSTSIDTKVEDGYVVISGKQEKKSKEGNSVFTSTFNKAFPVATNVESAKMQTTAEDGKIVLRFPKLKDGA